MDIFKQIYLTYLQPLRVKVHLEGTARNKEVLHRNISWISFYNERYYDNSLIPQSRRGLE